MVLMELAVVATVAWFFGYLLAMAAVPAVLASVGFMQFEPLGFNVNPAIGFEQRCSQHWQHWSSTSLRSFQSQRFHGT